MKVYSKGSEERSAEFTVKTIRRMRAFEKFTHSNTSDEAEKTFLNL